MVKKRSVISIFGGRGFLGKQICEEAIRHKYTVNSINRSIPKILDEDSLAKINWKLADILKENDAANDQCLHDILKETDVVVHSIGAMFKNPAYKNILKNGGSINGITSFGQFLMEGVFEKCGDKSSINNHLDTINHLSAIKLAERFISINPKKKHLKFVYISSDGGNCLMPNEEYLRSKRNAEYDLLELSKYYGTEKFSNLILRPGIMLDDSDGHTSVRLQLIKNNKWLFTNTISVQQVSKRLFELLETTKDNDSIISLDELRR